MIHRKSRDQLTVVAAVVVALILGTAISFAVAIPATIRLTRVTDPRPGAPALRALFSHPQHGSLRCHQCHAGTFPQTRLSFRHADMDQGRACGSCHNGRRTTAVTAFSCEACHAP